MRYYLVKCKFGHVGRDKYLPLEIPVYANSAKEASLKAKRVKGVKRDHKDWCLSEPVLIDKELYEIRLSNFKNDIYFEKKTRPRIHLFEDRLVDEPRYTRINGIKTNKITNIKKRDLETINYKIKKTKEIIKSLMGEIYYYMTMEVE